jgi:hypothetical protein
MAKIAAGIRALSRYDRSRPIREETYRRTQTECEGLRMNGTMEIVLQCQDIADGISRGTPLYELISVSSTVTKVLLQQGGVSS